MNIPSDILKAKILIVDDQEANVALLEHILAGAGYTSVSSTMDARAVSICIENTATTPFCSTSTCRT